MTAQVMRRVNLALSGSAQEDSWAAIGETACLLDRNEYKTELSKLEADLVHWQGLNLEQDPDQLHPLDLCKTQVVLCIPESQSLSVASVTVSFDD